MIMLFFPVMGGQLELAMGSTAYLSLIGLVVIVTNTIFICLAILLYYLGVTGALFWQCAGFWSVIFAFITIDCMQVRRYTYLTLHTVVTHSTIYVGVGVLF